ncbi:MAG TPA: type II toxin-antitoxin system PemK/MazF family toxin [Tepidisphaeraceae bacterium]
MVLVDFPYPSGSGSKVRPALVVQNDKDNARLLNTIIAQITGTTPRSLEATQVLIETGTSDGKQSGLAFDSVVNCINVTTIAKARVLRKLGSLSAALTARVNDALKAGLDLT